MKIETNIYNQQYNSPQMGFAGAKEKERFIYSLKNHCDYHLIGSANDDRFKGITSEELNSVEVQQAIKNRKAKAIFDGSIKAVNLALEIINESFAK